MIRGIITIWKAYHVKEDESNDMLSTSTTCKCNFFEEKSSLTKLLCLSPETLAYPLTCVSNDSQLCDKLPVNERTLKLTTIQMLTHIGDQHLAQEHYTLAYDVYKYALTLVNCLILRNEPVVEKLTHILRCMGLIKCSTGDVEAGMSLIERCIHIYEESGERDAEYKVASFWIDMGYMYMKQQWSDTSLFEQLMSTVRDQIEHEERMAATVEDYDSDDESDDDDDYWSVLKKLLVVI